MTMQSARRNLWWLGIVVAALVACGKSDKKADTTAGGSGSATVKPSNETVRVTGIPTENPTEMQRKYQPMVDYLKKKLGRDVSYVPLTDYGAAVAALEAGKVDFAWLGGFTYVQARVMTGVVPLAQRDIDQNFKTIFIASADSGINTPADIKGKTFAFGSKSSTSGHLMPRHFLITEYKIDPDKDLNGAPVYSGAHDATVKLVESGKVQAGALDGQVWERMTREKQYDPAKVKVIWTTPPFKDYLWTARKDFDPALREAFTKAFLELDINNPEHKPVLEIQGATKFVPANAADYDTVEEVARSTGLLAK